MTATARVIVRTRVGLALGALALALVACANEPPNDEREVAVTAQALVGSCEYSCGEQSPDGCWCDQQCTSLGDCCDDYVPVCALSGSCAGNCGGSAGSCFCDEACRGFGDCCDDYVPECRRSVVRMSAGGRQTCAQFFDGGVRCWGIGQHGVLGYNAVADVPTPESAPGDVNVGAPVSRIVTGYYHTCALLSGGAVKCWGRNTEGQLGYPGHGDVGDGAGETLATMPNVNVGGTVTQLAAGTHHTCALLSGGSVKCWGSNAFGQLGYPGVASVTNPATAGLVNVGGTVSAIFAGTGFHTCARLSTGALRCWGDNSMGQLGYGLNSGTWMKIGDTETPASAGNVPVGAILPVPGAGPTTTCALPSSGGVKCWGDGASVLGDGSGATFGDNEPASSAPTLLPGEFLIAVGSGSTHHCVLTALGGVKCWGYIPLAGLGYGSPAAVLTAASAGLIDVGGPVSSLAIGHNHICATLVNGGARCWGQQGLHGYSIADGIGDAQTPADMGNIFFP
jgi:hypothetical protein